MYMYIYFVYFAYFFAVSKILYRQPFLQFASLKNLLLFFFQYFYRQKDLHYEIQKSPFFGPLNFENIGKKVYIAFKPH